MRSEGRSARENFNLSAGRSEGNDSGKKALGLISKTTTLHVDHAILCISLPSLHDYVNTRQQPPFPFPEL